MSQKLHIQWALYDMDNKDYYVSLNREILDKVKEWNIVKSKIVYSSYNYEEIGKMMQKDLYITLLSDEERNKNFWETKFIRTSEKVWLKISNRLLNILINENPKDYEHRYDMMWNKIHFLIKETEEPFSDKWWFDQTFKSCERINKRQLMQLDLFESEYISVYKPK